MTDLDIITIYNNEKIKVSSLCKKYPEIKDYLLHRFQDTCNKVEVIYRLLNNIDKAPTCPICNNFVPFVSMQIGYKTFCSNECLNSIKGKEYLLNKTKQSMLKKYGVDNPMKLKDIKEKAYQTNLEKYGVKHPIQNKEIQEKTYQTMQEKYGVKHALQSKKCYNKLKLTMQEKYGVEYALQSENIHNNFIKTMQEKYGVNYTAQSKELQEKMKQTNLEKYGVDNPMKSENIQEKQKQTNLEKYGVEYISQVKEFNDKKCKNNLNKYGVEYTVSLPEIKQKIKNTFINKYGENYIELFIEKGKNTKLKNGTYATSKIEQELFKELKTQYGENNIIHNYKSEQYPFACDFYIKTYNLYIEIQGNWTHGKHPYDINDINDNNILNKWKNKKTQYYNSAINVWTIKDVNKRNLAKEHNLNYIEIFSINLNYCKKVINDYIKNNLTGYYWY